MFVSYYVSALSALFECLSRMYLNSSPIQNQISHTNLLLLHKVQTCFNLGSKIFSLAALIKNPSPKTEMFGQLFHACNSF